MPQLLIVLSAPFDRHSDEIALIRQSLTPGCYAKQNQGFTGEGVL